MKKACAIHPYSRPHVLAKIDGRRREALLMRRVRADLLAHLGGQPSATARALVERAVILQLYVSLFDKRAAESGGMLSERDTKTYLAFSNSLARVLRALGNQPHAQPRRGPTLAEAAAEGRREREEGRFSA